MNNLDVMGLLPEWMCISLPARFPVPRCLHGYPLAGGSSWSRIDRRSRQQRGPIEKLYTYPIENLTYYLGYRGVALYCDSIIFNNDVVTVDMSKHMRNDDSDIIVKSYRIADYRYAKQKR